MSAILSTEHQVYFVAERGYPISGENMRWVGEWSDPDLGKVRDFLTQFHIRPDEQVRVVKVTKTETRSVE